MADCYEIEIRGGVWAPANEAELWTYARQSALLSEQFRFKSRQTRWIYKVAPDDVKAALELDAKRLRQRRGRAFDNRWKIVDNRGQETFMTRSDIDPAARYRIQYRDNGDLFDSELAGYEVPAFLDRLEDRWNAQATGLSENDVNGGLSDDDFNAELARECAAIDSADEALVKSIRIWKAGTWGALIGLAVFLWTFALVWGLLP